MPNRLSSLEFGSATSVMYRPPTRAPPCCTRKKSGRRLMRSRRGSRRVMTWPTPQLRVAVRWLSRDRQTLTSLGAPTTEYTPTRRGAHSHAKNRASSFDVCCSVEKCASFVFTSSSYTATTAHDTDSISALSTAGRPARWVADLSAPLTARRETTTDRLKCVARRYGAVLQSRPCSRLRRSPLQSFPHLWKKCGKSMTFAIQWWRYLRRGQK